MESSAVSTPCHICFRIVFLCINYFSHCDCSHKYLYTDGHNSAVLISLLKSLLNPTDLQQILEWRSLQVIARESVSVCERTSIDELRGN